MTQKNQKRQDDPSYKDYPFQDKLEDRKKHFRVGRTINRAGSGVVKFRVADILQFIDDYHLAGKPNAKLVFHFAAYKNADWESYITKPGAVDSGITKGEFLSRPTLILAYENSPVSVESFDCGLLCPPPPGC